MEAMRAQLEREADSTGRGRAYNASLGVRCWIREISARGKGAAPASASVEESGALATTPAVQESPASAAPVPDLFSEQKA